MSQGRTPAELSEMGKAANRMRGAKAEVRRAAADLVRDISAGRNVSPERVMELSLSDLAVIAFDLNEKDHPSPKDRIAAHQIIQERLGGKPTQKTESESTNRFIFEPPDWWGPAKPEGEVVELHSSEPAELPPAA